MNPFSPVWTVSLARGDAAPALGPLRTFANLAVAEAGETLWLGGNTPAEEPLSLPLAALPATGRFEMAEPADGQTLRRPGERVPCGTLPPGLSWEPLAQWLTVVLPGTRLPALAPASVPLRLLRSALELPAGALLTDAAAWAAWAGRASDARLGPLRFAAAADGAVFIVGDPLPAVSGVRCVVREGVAVPAGFRWEPVVSPATVRRVFGLAADDTLLWTEPGGPTVLAAEQFVPASRSAARMTAETLETSFPGHDG